MMHCRVQSAQLAVCSNLISGLCFPAAVTHCLFSVSAGIGTASGLSGVDIKVIAGRGFAFLWETAEAVTPGLELHASGAMLCHNPVKVSE